MSVFETEYIIIVVSFKKLRVVFLDQIKCLTQFCLKVWELKRLSLAEVKMAFFFYRFLSMRIWKSSVILKTYTVQIYKVQMALHEFSVCEFENYVSIIFHVTLVFIEQSLCIVCTLICVALINLFLELCNHMLHWFLDCNMVCNCIFYCCRKIFSLLILNLAFVISM